MKTNFYLSILNELKISTNLSSIQEKLKISKQQLNYFLVKLKKGNYIIQKGRGWYEVNKSKNLTNYDSFLSKDTIRGHGFVWKINIPKIKDWENRIEVLKKNNIHFNLVGAKENTPRIKVLGRKVWLCNGSIRVFDKGGSSYFGTNAVESRNSALNEIKLIIGVLMRKLNIYINPSSIHIQKNHYALIKNDLAIEENKRGNIIRISDEDGEWLLVDDSNEEGGELENVGKKAFTTNIPMSKWWNNQKETNFQVTPTFVLESLNKLTNITAQNQIQLLEYSKQNKEHLKLIQEYRKENRLWRKNYVKETKQKEQSRLDKWF